MNRRRDPRGVRIGRVALWLAVIPWIVQLPQLLSLVCGGSGFG